MALPMDDPAVAPTDGRRLAPSVLVLLYALAQFAYVYWSHPYNPFLHKGMDLGWYGWSDQGSYLSLAASLANLQRPAAFYGGPGYPILGVPFVKLLPVDPFLLPNLALYLGTTLLCFWIARRFLSPEISLLAIIILNQSSYFVNLFVSPWSNSVPTFCMALLLYLILYPPATRPVLAAAVTGIAIAWTLAARYGDALLLVPPGLYLLYRLGRDVRQRALLCLVSALAGLPIILFVGWLHYKVFGSPLTTPYSFMPSASTGYNSESMASRDLAYVGYHLFSSLVNPTTFDSSIAFTPIIHSLADRALLSHYFLLVLAAVGLLVLRRELPGLVYAFSISLLLALLYYGTFWSTAASELKFHSLRFYQPWVPMLVFAAVAGVCALLRADWRQPPIRRLAGVGVGLTLLLVLGLYGLGRALPPFPDTRRAVPRISWNVTTNLEGTTPRQVLDNNVMTGWHGPGVLPVGTEFRVGMQRSFAIDGLFLVRRAGNTEPAPQLTIYVSNDNKSWSNPTSLSQELLDQRIVAYRFDRVPARFIRLALAAPTSEQGWSIDEIFVYGQLGSEE